MSLSRITWFAAAGALAVMFALSVCGCGKDEAPPAAKPGQRPGDGIRQMQYPIPDPGSLPDPGSGTGEIQSGGRCGDNFIETWETCDGTNLGGQYCEKLGYRLGGVLKCKPDCSGFDVSGCWGICGDNRADCHSAVPKDVCISARFRAKDEECDGTDLAGHNCGSFAGYVNEGKLACSADCKFVLSNCTTWRTKNERDLAKKFAPILKFHSRAQGYPMSAQEYYEKIILKGLHFRDGNYLSHDALYNKTIDQGEVPPTYWMAIECDGGNGRKQYRIMYWWFYGLQLPCKTPLGKYKWGSHGDWERIMVTLSESQKYVAAITYYQDNGNNTRIPVKTPRHLKNGHPIVYVEGNRHANFSRSNKGDSRVTFLGFKLYDSEDVADSRIYSCGFTSGGFDGEGKEIETWENLVKLTATGGEEWMKDDSIVWGGILKNSKGTILSHRGSQQHPLKSVNQSFCNVKACKETHLDMFGKETVCNRLTDCEAGDNDRYYSCWHCPSGYTDCGSACAEGGSGNCILPWRLKTIKTYYYDYWISRNDEGLMYKRHGW